MSERLSIKLAESAGTVVVVELNGELDLSTAAQFESTLEHLPAAAQRVVVDLSRVSFLDSTGLRALLLASRSLREKSRTFRVVQGTPQVRRLLALTRVEEQLELADDLAAALVQP